MSQSIVPPADPPPVSRSSLLLHALGVLLLSAYPLSVVVRANLGVVPIRLSAILFVLAINLVLVAVDYEDGASNAVRLSVVGEDVDAATARLDTSAQQRLRCNAVD